MTFNKWIAFLATSIACGSMTFGSQSVDNSGVKPEKPVQVEFITPEELKTKIANNEPIAVVDLRGPSVYAQSDKTIRGAMHTKVRKVASRLRDVPRDKEVITYCACPADEAATHAARRLLASGFQRVRVLKGGWSAWLQAGGQVQPKPGG